MVEHPESLAADFRELFSVGLAGVPVWEACLLVRALLVDPRSRVAAVRAGWDSPVSREWMLLAAVHDVVIDTTPGVKSPGKYHLPRPWDTKRVRLGGGRLTGREALKILRPDGLNRPG